MNQSEDNALRLAVEKMFRNDKGVDFEVGVFAGVKLFRWCRTFQAWLLTKKLGVATTSWSALTASSAICSKKSIL